MTVPSGPLFDGFVVTKLKWSSRRIVRFYNQRVGFVIKEKVQR